MTDPLTTEAIYLRLGGLIADTPDFKAAPTPETHRWVAQVLALIEAGKLVERVDIITFKGATQDLQGALRARTPAGSWPSHIRRLRGQNFTRPPSCRGRSSLLVIPSMRSLRLARRCAWRRPTCSSSTRMPTRRCLLTMRASARQCVGAGLGRTTYSVAEASSGALAAADEATS